MNAYDTLIVGAGCAGLKCADELASMGRTRILVLADDPQSGTSRNAGSDKQTYYKLTLSGREGDSVGEMAQTLFAGGCVDGLNALCEAALSAKCFLRLCELGVPFPMNRYGEYIGYKTDHDPRRRATSAGPLTSKFMAQALEKSVRARNIPILGGRLAVKIIVENGRARGVLCLNLQTNEWETFLCNHLVWATGGPADIYESACYPASQFGMSGALFIAGAAGANLTEWQYGLASVSPRWNVSGTYMQALPRFVSTDENGGGAREFLLPGFQSAGDMLTSVFLKGYQWPFDARKAQDGSSRVDLMVQREIQSGRRVFLDFTRDPDGLDFSRLSKEAGDYLARAGALQSTPFARLYHMNAPAVAFYQNHKVNLQEDKLEIALCAQHMNGGIEVNEWWETGVRGLFAVGEVAGTHGVYRPGGSALNAGQAGAARAARRIAQTPEREPEAADTRRETMWARSLAEACLGKLSNLSALRQRLSREMSLYAAAVRVPSEIARMAEESFSLLAEFENAVRIADKAEIAGLFRFRDALMTRCMVLSAMRDYAEKGGENRGSAMYTVPGENDMKSQIQVTRQKDNRAACAWRSVKPLPEEDDFFENIWREYREGKW